MRSWLVGLFNAALLLGCLLRGGASLAAPPPPFTHPQLNVTLTIPDGFVADPNLLTASKDFLAAYRRPASDEDAGIDTLVILERMRGTLNREPLDLSDARAKARPGLRLSTFTWDGFEVQALEVPEMNGAAEVINYNVQVPTVPEAVQLRVVGPKANAVELRALTSTMLSNLQGRTNWLRSAAPPGVANSPHYGKILLAVFAVIVIGGSVVLFLLRRVMRRGGVLAVAAIIYVASFGIPKGESREMRGINGAVRMLGFVGLVLGVIDLAKPYKRRSPPPPPLPSPPRGN